MIIIIGIQTPKTRADAAVLWYSQSKMQERLSVARRHWVHNNLLWKKHNSIVTARLSERSGIAKRKIGYKIPNKIMYVQCSLYLIISVFFLSLLIFVYWWRYNHSGAEDCIQICNMFVQHLLFLLNTNVIQQ